MVALTAIGGSGVAEAAPRRAFAVAAQPLAAALLDFAVQANISIAADEASHCGRMSGGVQGAFTVAEALDQLLAGTGCGFRAIDAASIKIVRLPAREPQGARAPPRASPPIAQPPPTPSALGEVVVTATRRSALTVRLPDAVSVVQGQRMDTDRDFAIADLAGQVAGLIVTNPGPGSDKSILRGLSDGSLTGHAQSTVGIYLDDTRLTYNAPDPDLRLIDVDQVEVLQGPQGALYGSGSIGGLIHIVTRQPDLGQYGGMIAIEGSDTERGAASALVEGELNAPIVPDELGLRAVAYGEHDGGYVNDVNLGRKDANRTDRTGGRVAVKLDISPDWSLDVGAVTQTLDSADSQYGLARLGDYNRRLNLTEPHDNNFDEVHVTLEGATPPGQFKNTLSFVRHEVDTRYDATSDLALFDPNAEGAAAYNEADRIATLIDEATLTSVGASPLKWLIGAFASNSRQGLGANIATTASASPANAVVYDEDRTDTIDELAVYGEASLAITSRLAAGAGARVGVTDVSTDSVVRAPWDDAIAPFRGRLSDLHWEPKLSLRYRITDRLLGYALASEGARGGGFNTGGPIGTVFSGSGGLAEPFRRFSGDELWNLEVGMKARALSDHLSLRVVAFYDLWRNIQSDQILPSGIVYTANIGDGRNVGAEVEAAYAIGDFEASLATMVDEPELLHRTSPFPSLIHSGLPGAPRATVGGALHYQRHGQGFQPFCGSSVDYVGLSRLDFDARVSRRMGDYTVTRLVGGVRDDRWRLAAFADNPLGAVGDTFAFGNPFTLRHSRQVTPLRPMTSGLELTRTF